MDFSTLILSRLCFQISLLIFFVIVIEAVCRIVGSLAEKKIKGLEFFLGMLAGALYVFTIMNVCGVLFSFIPSDIVKQLLSYGGELWLYCLCSLFVSEIYGIDFVPALVLCFVAFSVAMAINVYLFILGPFGMQVV